MRYVMRRHRIEMAFIAVFVTAALTGTALAQGFQGGGGSVFLGTGTPDEITAATDLANDLNLEHDIGNVFFGAQGFYQADRYRVGASFQTSVWGGWRSGENNAGDNSAGVVTFTAGFYSTYTIRHDRFLFNVGGVVGGGRAGMGFDLGEQDIDEFESVSTFYVEPQVSVGVAACAYFGVEFQLSAPVYLLTDDLRMTYSGRTYSVSGSDLNGLTFAVKLTFGKFANPL